jgi:hypothetical protein
VQVEIDSRFRGPHASGNGGYTCGIVAALVGGPVEVTLRLPPPLDRPLDVERDGDVVRVLDGDAVVAEATPAQVDLDVPEPVSFDDAMRAATPDLDSPFPECFVCGHARPDGLHVFAGPVAGREVVASPWIPAPDVVGPEFVWAALDCPGAYATGVLGRGTVVLGRLAARVDRVPDAGERCVVVGWSLGGEGRKHHAGTALFGEAGDVVGTGRALWIEPR